MAQDNFDPLMKFIYSMWFKPGSNSYWIPNNGSYSKSYQALAIHIYIHVAWKLISIEHYSKWTMYYHQIKYKNISHLMDTILFYDNLYSKLEDFDLPF